MHQNSRIIQQIIHSSEEYSIEILAKDFGLKKDIKKKPITQKKAAKLRKVTPKTIREWEKGGKLKRINNTGHPLYDKQEVLTC